MRSTHHCDAIFERVVVDHAQDGDAHVAADSEGDHEADTAEKGDRQTTTHSTARRSTAVHTHSVHPRPLRPKKTHKLQFISQD